jgi:ArsR family transcriptional regulator
MAFYREHGHDREKAMAFVCDQADPISPPVLDIGCGKGMTALEIVRRVPDLISIDLSEEEIFFAKTNFEAFGVHEGIRLVRADASLLPFSDALFKTVFMVNTLHHLFDPMPILEDAARVLSPDGRLVIADFTEEGFQIINRIHGLDGGEHKRNKHSIDQIVGRLKSLGLLPISRQQGHHEEVAVMARIR